MTAATVPYEEILQRRILIIDDEEANLLLLETLLKREGYSQIHCLSDPMQAVEKLVEFDPHIILLDLMMPDIDGYQLLDSFRRQSRPEEFRPVLVLTADTTLQARRRALSLGAKDFVSKPFDVIEIALRISNLLETQILYERVRNPAARAPGFK
ncbi:response regulator [Henriciella barbarensis]|uniref:Response regulator n=1 Tax=Henriciella barbarensis TaxID=86342 RepID=A0A399R0C5_9PROT|nr:response regulator [Henriciella barbarensis]RIJ24610.1 response regulator [Henriciella barbarensis]